MNKSFPLLFLFLFFIISKTWSQTFTDINANSLERVSNISPHATAWGDYDNDGDLDILLSGINQYNSPVTKLYKNTNGIFSTAFINFPTTAYHSVEWGDYDNDGDLDIILSGNGQPTKIFRNTGNNFTDINANLPSTDISSTAWGDYDNDGDLDFLLMGWLMTKLYVNMNGTFIDSNINLLGLYEGSVEWGDYDNDGDLDILLSGRTNKGNDYRHTKIYKNENYTFSEIQSYAFNDVKGMSSWGDYDNDGDLDILLVGSNSISKFFKVYTNTNGIFTDSNQTLENTIDNFAAAWGDYDNDGDLDIIVTGINGTKIYKNSTGIFSNTNDASLPTSVGQSVAWGDYDNDGDLDFFFLGYYVSRIYRNNSINLNTIPSTPTGLKAEVTGNDVLLEWNKATDNQTPQETLTYSIRIVNSSNNSQVVSPMANNTTGYRRIVSMGNANHATSKVIKNLKPGTYNWIVQAIDQNFAGSAFSSEGSFTITNPPVPPQIIACNPIAHSQNAPASSDVEISFSQLLSASTISGNALKIHGSSTGLRSLATRGFFSGNGSNKVAFNPIYDFSPGEKVSVTVTGQAKSFDDTFIAKPEVYTFLSAVASSSAHFKVSSEVSIGLKPNAVCSADFDGDRDIDFATATANGIFIHFNNGVGLFPDSTNILEGNNILSICAADFDNDGDIDITASVDQITGKIKVLLNTGKGVFSVASEADINMSPTTIQSGDLNGDGDLDLVTAGTESNTIFVLLNDQGNFIEHVPISNGLHPHSLSIADMDNDQDLDIVATNFDSRNLTVFLNEGSANFSNTSNLIVPINPSCVLANDYNRDGNIDLIIGSKSSKEIILLLNDGTAKFLSTPLLKLDNTANALFSADYNGDGNQDLAIADSDNILIQVNDGTGNFSKASETKVSMSPLTMVSADFDGDKDIDIISADTSSNNISVLLNWPVSGSPVITSFLPSRNFPSALNKRELNIIFSEPIIGNSASSSAIHVFGSLSGLLSIPSKSNFDGANTDTIKFLNNTNFLPGEKISVTVTKNVQNQNGVSLNNSQVYSFTTATEKSPATFVSNAVPDIRTTIIQTADFNGDGYLDVAAPNQNTRNTVSILLNDGLGRFTTIQELIVGDNLNSIVPADYDSDGDIDIVTSSRNVNLITIYLNDGTGFFESAGRVSVQNPSSIQASDFDGDGDVDLISTSTSISFIYVTLNNGNGTFAQPKSYYVAKSASTSCSGDFDNDGDIDIATNNTTTFDGLICIAFNDGTANFPSFKNSVVRSGTGISSNIQTNDMDNDGDLDLVISSQDYLIYILTNDGFGNFRESSSLSGYGNISLGDFNGDGSIDIASNIQVNGSFPANVAIRFNDGQGFFSDIPNSSLFPIEGLATYIHSGDYDSDGDLDISSVGNTSGSMIIAYNDAAPSISQISKQIICQGTLNKTVTFSINDVDSSTDQLLVTATSSNNSLLPNANIIVTGTGKDREVTLTPIFYRTGSTTITLTVTDNKGNKKSSSFTFEVTAIPVLVVTNPASVCAPTTINLTTLFSDANQTNGAVSYWLDAQTTKPLTNPSSINQSGTYYIKKVTSSGGCTDIKPVLITIKPLVQVVSGHDQTIDFNSSAITLKDFSPSGGVWTGRGIRSPLGIFDPSVSGAGTFILTYTVKQDGCTFSSSKKMTVTAPFTEISTIAFPSVYYATLDWGDYDNDGDLDVLLTGEMSVTNSGTPLTKVYQNNNGIFTDINASIIGVLKGDAQWADYDNDGDFDILLTGYSEFSTIKTAITKLYKNNNGSFTDTNIPFKGVGFSAVDWGDYDNDGDLDFIVTGQIEEEKAITKIYQNNNGNFIDINAALQSVQWGDVDWGDYDNDGDLDILCSGLTGPISYPLVTKVYKNDNGIFRDTNSLLPGIFWGSSIWGDYDNDGDLDILLSGESTTSGGATILKIYNNAFGIFTETNATATLVPITYGECVWGDYDNDGDLDILTIGSQHPLGAVNKIFRNNNGIFSDINNLNISRYTPGTTAWGDYDNDGDLDIISTWTVTNHPISTKIYRNNNSKANSTPSTPANLRTLVNGNEAILTWDKATDNQTATNGLTYNIWLSSESESKLIIPPMSNIFNGYRQVIEKGNVNHNTTWHIKNLSPGIYYWSVQAIDNIFAGSNFASKIPFAIEPNTSITLNGLNRMYDGTSKPIEITTVPESLPVTITYNGSSTPPTLPGTYSVIAMVHDQNYYGVVIDSLIIEKANQYITFEKIADRTIADSIFSLNATSTSNLPISFSVVEGQATIVNNMITLNGAGEVIIRATQEGNNLYQPALSIEQTFDVHKKDQTITFNPLVNKTEGDKPFYLDAKASSKLPISYSVTTGFASILNDSLYILGPGKVLVKAFQEGNEQFNAATAVEQSFCILPQKPSITVVESNNSSTFTLTSSSPIGNQWLLDGQEIIGANIQTFDVSQTGSYSLRVIIDGCKNVSDANPISITGVAEIPSLNNFISIFPNPASDKVVITFSNLESTKNTTVKIFNSIGILIRYYILLNINQTTKQTILDINKFAQGRYTVLILAGNKQHTASFIKY
jgi:hypothetical protein